MMAQAQKGHCRCCSCGGAVVMERHGWCRIFWGWVPGAWPRHLRVLTGRRTGPRLRGYSGTPFFGRTGHRHGPRHRQGKARATDARDPQTTNPARPSTTGISGEITAPDNSNIAGYHLAHRSSGLDAWDPHPGEYLAGASLGGETPAAGRVPPSPQHADGPRGLPRIPRTSFSRDGCARTCGAGSASGRNANFRGPVIPRFDSTAGGNVEVLATAPLILARTPVLTPTESGEP